MKRRKKVQAQRTSLPEGKHDGPAPGTYNTALQEHHGPAWSMPKAARMDANHDDVAPAPGDYEQSVRSSESCICLMVLRW